MAMLVLFKQFLRKILLKFLPLIVTVKIKESNRLKYRSSSGSRLFKNLGSGSVRVQLHQNLKVPIRFGFIKTKFLRLKFGSGSLNPNFKGSVRVHRKKSVFTGSRFRFGFTSKFLIWPKTKLGFYIIKITKYKLHARIN